jgi:hypothetical protein
VEIRVESNLEQQLAHAVVQRNASQKYISTWKLTGVFGTLGGVIKLPSS